MITDTRQLDFSSDRVKRIRIALGETQARFAQRIGVSPDMVHRWERGHAEPMRGPTIKALLDAERLVS